MNRVLHYFKNIKFNPLVNKTIANQGKKKYAVNIIKNHKKNYYQHISVRKFSKTTGRFTDRKPPNNDNWRIIYATMLGIYFTIIVKDNQPSQKNN